jgi:alpha-glucosidase
VTRFGGSETTPGLAKMMLALLFSLKGTALLYQGEELGLTEAEVPFEALQEPYGIAFGPQFKGRDGCRTPMPWTTGVHGGFTRGTPWLPMPQEHLALAVAQQQAGETSTLNGFRAFMRWRHRHPALRTGAIRFLDTAEPVLAFTREAAGETLLVAFNLSDAPADLAAPALRGAQPLHGHGLHEGTLDGECLHLPAYGAMFASLAEMTRNESAPNASHAGAAP